MTTVTTLLPAEAWEQESGLKDETSSIEFCFSCTHSSDWWLMSIHSWQLKSCLLPLWKENERLAAHSLNECCSFSPFMLTSLIPKSCWEHSTGKQVNWYQVTLSRGASLKGSVQQLKNNVSQCTIAAELIWDGLRWSGFRMKVSVWTLNVFVLSSLGFRSTRICKSLHSDFI